MFYKEFEGTTEQEALEKAKAELGSDVIITHIKNINYIKIPVFISDIKVIIHIFHHHDPLL